MPTRGCNEEATCARNTWILTETNIRNTRGSTLMNKPMPRDQRGTSHTHSLVHAYTHVHGYGHKSFHRHKGHCAHKMRRRRATPPITHGARVLLSSGKARLIQPTPIAMDAQRQVSVADLLFSTATSILASSTTFVGSPEEPYLTKPIRVAFPHISSSLFLPPNNGIKEAVPSSDRISMRSWICVGMTCLWRPSR
mgnify:CR=1 FL=1